MKDSVIVEEKLLRVECDRILRSYRQMNSVLLSSRSYGRVFGDEDKIDEAAMRAQMYSIRSAILDVEDSRERLFLYHYYIKGQSLKTCGKILGISDRSACRLKSRALENLILKVNNKN